MNVYQGPAAERLTDERTRCTFCGAVRAILNTDEPCPMRSLTNRTHEWDDIRDD